MIRVASTVESQDILPEIADPEESLEADQMSIAFQVKSFSRGGYRRRDSPRRRNDSRDRSRRDDSRDRRRNDSRDRRRKRSSSYTKRVRILLLT